MATASQLQKHQTFQERYMTVSLSWDDQVAGRPSDLVQAAMASISLELLNRSKARAPRRSGRLVSDSGVVTSPRGDEWRIQYHQPYARRQHYAHPTGGRPGRGRRTIRSRSRSGITPRRLWLANTIRDELDEIEREIAARIRGGT